MCISVAGTRAASRPARLPVARLAVTGLPVARMARADLIRDPQRWRLSVRKQVAERLPTKLLASDAQQADEARGRRLRIGERMVRPAMRHSEALTEALEADGVAQPPHLRGEPGRVDVVGIESGADSARDQPRVERVGAVLDEH